MTKLISYLTLFMLTGCAAALVPESSDPKTKIAQATDLFNEQGRVEGAMTLLNQAIPLAQKKNDKPSEAIAEFYLAEIYKAPGRGWERVQDLHKAIEHYERSIAIYNEISFFKSSALMSWMEAGAYILLKDKTAVCGALHTSKKSYEKPGAVEQDNLPPMFAGGKLPMAIEAQQKKNQCK